jgi:hypothetical protein
MAGSDCSIAPGPTTGIYRKHRIDRTLAWKRINALQELRDEHAKLARLEADISWEWARYTSVPIPSLSSKTKSSALLNAEPFYLEPIREDFYNRVGGICGSLYHSAEG